MDGDAPSHPVLGVQACSGWGVCRYVRTMVGGWQAGQCQSGFLVVSIPNSLGLGRGHEEAKPTF